MRKIKFRAWDKRSKQMITEQVLWNLGMMVAHPNDYEVIQFTGLGDKNGKEIYEGDVVKGIWGDNEIDIFKIAFEDTGWWGIGKDNYAIGDYHTLEVIGNIYDNPELLNGEETQKVKGVSP